MEIFHQCDNGVKLVDPDGEMLCESWEKHASVIGNCTNEELQCELEKLIELESIDVCQHAVVLIGKDTRLLLFLLILIRETLDEFILSYFLLHYF